MKYKIVDFNEKTAQIILQVEDYPLITVDLPLDENQNVPTGTELDLYLKGFIPTWHIDRKEKLTKGIANAEEILSLVTPLPIIEPTLEELVVDVRKRRDETLCKSDWTQLPDTNLTDIEKQLWKEYRQALRDIPSQNGFPNEIVWPAFVDLEHR